jgi:hypothetical protein
VQKLYSTKEPMPGTFDEAQLSVFQELLPFWAAFVRNGVYKPKEDKRAERRRLLELKRLKKKKLPCTKSNHFH